VCGDGGAGAPASSSLLSKGWAGLGPCWWGLAWAFLGSMSWCAPSNGGSGTRGDARHTCRLPPASPPCIFFSFLATLVDASPALPSHQVLALVQGLEREPVRKRNHRGGLRSRAARVSRGRVGGKQRGIRVDFVGGAQAIRVEFHQGVPVSWILGSLTPWGLAVLIRAGGAGRSQANEATRPPPAPLSSQYFF
jgi:hypothetical protein